MASTQNLASGVLASSISSSTTTISVNSGSGSATTLQNVWPDPPFYATIMPTNPMAGVSNSLDSEVVLITAATGTSDGSTVTMTAERGKKGTTAKAFSEGAVITNGIYAETGVFTATKNGTTYTISDVRAPMPSEGVKILVKFDTSYTNTTAPSLVVNGYGSGAITMFGSTFANADNGLGAQISKDFVYQLAYTNVGGTAIWQVLNVHNNIQTADIADSAVTSDKIDFATFTRKFEWFTTSNGNGNTVEIVSPSGRKYTAMMHNGGTGLSIRTNGQYILAYRMICSRPFTSTITGNYGVQGLAKGSTVCCRMYGSFNNGTVSTMTEVSDTTGTVNYTNLGGAHGGAKTNIAYEATGMRLDNDSLWRIFGKIASSNVQSTMSFDAEMTAMSSAIVPGIYQRGGTDSNTTDGVGFIWVEFIEKA